MTTQSNSPNPTVWVSRTFSDMLAGNFRSYKGNDNQYGYTNIDLASSMDVRALQFALATTPVTIRICFPDNLRNDFRIKMQPLEFVSTSHINADVLMQQPACCDWSDIWMSPADKPYDPVAECLTVVMSKSVFDVHRTETKGPLLGVITDLIDKMRNESPLLRDALRESGHASTVRQAV